MKLTLSVFLTLLHYQMVNDSASSVAGDINSDRPLSGGQPGFSTITLIFLPLQLVSVCLQELTSIWTQGFRFYVMVCNSSLSLLISLFITMFKLTYCPLGFPSTSINTCLNKCTSHRKEDTEHFQYPQNFLIPVTHWTLPRQFCLSRNVI